jgi:hypothetical protein
VTKTKLNREAVLQELELLEELKRRERERRESFTPNKGQAPVIEAFCDDKIQTILVLTGNGGGKTALGTNLAVEAAGGYIRHTKKFMDVPARVIVVLDKPEKVTDVWLPEIKKWYPLKEEQLHKRGKPYVSQITFNNGSELIFMFHDQDIMSFESIEGDVFIFDEPPPRHVFIGLRRAGRKKGRKPKYVIIGTPLAAPWMRTELYQPWSRGERPDIACFRFSTDVNRTNLSEGYIESFSQYLSDKEKRIRIHGEFFDLEGLALAHLFDREAHLIAPPRWPSQWPVIVVIDPHPRKAHVAIMLGIGKDDELYYLKEISSRSIPSQFAKELRDFYSGYRVVDIVCDSFGSSELTGGEGNLSFIRVLQDNGVRVRATTYDEKQDEAFIQMIQEVLAVPQEPDQFGERNPRLRIVNWCRGIIENIESVEWEKYRNIDEFKPKLAIGSKDYLACLKYGLAAQPRFTSNRSKPIRPKGAVGWSRNDKVKLHG